MRIATFNVNSIRARIDGTLAWLEQQQPDAVLLQETKVLDAEFPCEEFHRAGYGIAASGEKSYNGVAILSRHPLENVRVGLVDHTPTEDRRYISATILGLRCASVYVPNGKDVGHPAFQYKLAWLERLRATLQLEADEHSQPMIVGGDFNIARDERDVWSVEAMQDRIHFHPDERAALTRLLGDTLVDTYRVRHDDAREFSWWDYRGPSFRLNRGLRIDYLFASKRLLPSINDVSIDAAVRRTARPSDHVPVMLDMTWPQ